MADRFWVGGSGTWNTSNTANWSATSGGPGGASVPNSSDDVYLNASSGTGSFFVTLSGTTLEIGSLICTGFSGALSGTGTLSLWGSVTLSPTMTYPYTGMLQFVGGGIASLNTAGITIAPITVSKPTGTVNLASALVSSSSIAINNGTFSTNGFSVIGSQITIGGNANSKSLILGASTVSLSATTPISTGGASNFTLNFGTSNIVCTGAVTDFNLGSGTFTLHNLSLTNSTARTIAFSSTDPQTYNNLSITGPSNTGFTDVTFAQSNTFNGGLTTNSTASVRRVRFRSVTEGIAFTQTINGAGSLENADFRDIYVAGAAAPISGTRLGNMTGCSGINFDAPKTVFYASSNGGSWQNNVWALTDGGAVDVNNFPLPQDTAVFTNTRPSFGQSIIVSAALPFLPTVDMSARTTMMELNISSTQSVYGDWKNGTGVTFINVSTLNFVGRKLQTITTAGRPFSCPITVNSFGGTVELADALILSNEVLSVNAGTFDTKNYNVSVGSFQSNIARIRAIRLGSSLVTLDSSGSALSIGDRGLTFDPGTSHVVFNQAALGIFTNALTFHNVSFIQGGSSITFSGGTFNNLSVAAPASDGLTTLALSGDLTVNGTLTLAGATPTRRVFVRPNIDLARRTLNVNTLNATDCDFREINLIGPAAGSAQTRAGDCGGNTGIGFPAPKNVFWNLAGTNAWGANGWCSTSGGTPNVNNFPLAQDTAVFDNAGSATEVQLASACNVGSIDASARSSAMTLRLSSGSVRLHGNFLLGSGVTLPSSGSSLTLQSVGTRTLSTNGVSFPWSITIDAPYGVLQLGSAFSSGSSISLARGGFNANNYNVTSFMFSCGAADPCRINMGSGLWTVTGTGVVWSITTNQNTILDARQSEIRLFRQDTTGQAFEGGNRYYNKLTIAGATGNNTTSISGNNTFGELASVKPVAYTIALGSSQLVFGKWTATGTAGNVITVTGISVNHQIAGPATSGLDYLNMGSIGFNAASPGEFYVGANSTATGQNVIRTAAPAPRTLFWVGGTGNWGDTARWSTSSGGAGGAAIPTSLDAVVFDSASSAVAYTATVNVAARFASLTVSGPASGVFTLAGSSTIFAHGSVTFPATGFSLTHTGDFNLTGAGGGKTFTTNGQTFSTINNFNVNGLGCDWSLGSALTLNNKNLQLNRGGLSLGSFNLSCLTLNGANNNDVPRTINLGSATCTLGGGLNFATTESAAVGLTVIAGTSQLTLPSAGGGTFNLNGRALHNVSFTSNFASNFAINGSGSFNNLLFASLSSPGIRSIIFSSNFTINGTLTSQTGGDATRRQFIRSDAIGVTRTLTCNAVDFTDVDFRDITIAGAAAPAAGTRLGDCKGNSGITFPAAKTVYSKIGSGSWGSANWALTADGAGSSANFPLAQDTAVFTTTSPNVGATVSTDHSYNIGTIDMSARTSNAMTLATGSTTPAIYGNWINGTGVTLSGTGAMTFAGRGVQTITSAGKTFSQALTIDSPGGSVTAADALTCTGAISLNGGTFNCNGNTVTTNNSFNSAGSTARTLNFGSGSTLSVNSSVSISGSNFSVSGAGTFRMAGAGGNSFNHGGFQFPGITLDQAGAGSLTLESNFTTSFQSITNSRSQFGTSTINFGTCFVSFANWSARGTLANPLTITGFSASSPATIAYTGSGKATAADVDHLRITGIRAFPSGEAWDAGPNSVNFGSLGWLFASTAAAAPRGRLLLFFG